MHPPIEQLRRWIGVRFGTPATLEPLGEGEDYWAVVADGVRVYRFPKAEHVVRQLEAEIAVLPKLQHLPCPVPRIDAIGRPDGRDDLAWPFLGYPMLRGVFASRDTVPNPDAFLDELAEVLAVLHTTPEVSPFNDAPGVAWEPEPIEVDHPVGVRVVQWLEAHPRNDGPHAFCHDDLGMGHVLIDPDSNRITGIIDWGDCRFTDPAVDWIGAVYHWPSLVERRLPAETLLRTWSWALQYGLNDCLEGADWSVLETRLAIAEKAFDEPVLTGISMADSDGATARRSAWRIEVARSGGSLSGSG
ncbi:MAG: phosphotransferase, partial [Myxococcota bacterium]